MIRRVGELLRLEAQPIALAIDATALADDRAVESVYVAGALAYSRAERGAAS